jgi:hypothetical protein
MIGPEAPASCRMFTPVPPVRGYDSHHSRLPRPSVAESKASLEGPEQETVHALRPELLHLSPAMLFQKPRHQRPVHEGKDHQHHHHHHPKKATGAGKTPYLFRYIISSRLITLNTRSRATRDPCMKVRFGGRGVRI